MGLNGLFVQNLCQRRDGRAVKCAGLENQSLTATGVRISLSPLPIGGAGIGHFGKKNRSYYDCGGETIVLRGYTKSGQQFFFGESGHSISNREGRLSHLFHCFCR